MAPKISSAIMLALLLATSSAAAQAPAPAASASYPACTKTPSKAEMDAAHYAYLAGRHSFDEGDYATAITYFKDAYRRDCTKHELLPIIARAHELTQNRIEALLALETFLKRVPGNDPNVEPVKKRIANLKSQGEAKPASAAPLAAPAPAPRPGVDTNASLPSSPPGAASSSPTPSPSSPETNRSPSIVPWIVIGAGVTAAAVGTVVLVGGLDKRSHASAACPKTDKARICAPPLDANQVQQDYDDGTSAAVLGGIVMGVGAAAVVGGVVWMVIDRDASSTTVLAPWVGPSRAGVAWSSRF